MALYGSYGGEVETITCLAAGNIDVVALNDQKEQSMTGAGYNTLLVKDGTIPEACPLLIDVEEVFEGRNVEQFAACLTCPNSIIIDDSGLTEC